MALMARGKSGETNTTWHRPIYQVALGISWNCIMCACMYVCMYVCMYIYIHIIYRLYIYIHIYIYSYLYIYVYIYYIYSVNVWMIPVIVHFNLQRSTNGIPAFLRSRDASSCWKDCEWKKGRSFAARVESIHNTYIYTQPRTYLIQKM